MTSLPTTIGDQAGHAPVAHESEGPDRFTTTAYRRGPDERINKKTSIPFIALHFVPLLAFFTGVSRTALVLLAVTYFGRVFFITAGYHRYFAHRSYKLARIPQFLMAFGGTTAAQKGPLWWAGHHRDHHRYSDTEMDIHSPLRGFWWSHVGWILCDKYNDTPTDRIKDFAKYPELRFLNKHNWIGPWSLAIATFLIGGWSGLVIGFFLSTVLVWHATFLVNSLAHVIGRRRYATEDTSKNSVLIAVLTMGEGWHNNHHYHQSSARQGFFWWEWDPSYYVLRGLALVGIVKDLKRPSEAVLASNRIKDGAFDYGMFKAHWAKASRAVANTRSHLGDRLVEQRAHAAEALADRREALHDTVVDRREALHGSVVEHRELLAERAHALEDTLGERRQALEAFVHSSLESAEELARASRRRQRELGVDGI
jgi:stearoyl-CoA desaturase (delta-9 desaturase)